MLDTPQNIVTLNEEAIQKTWALEDTRATNHAALLYAAFARGVDMGFPHVKGKIRIRLPRAAAEKKLLKRDGTLTL